jgi:hypothetical protein
MASIALTTHIPDTTQSDVRYYARSFGNPFAQLYWNEDETLCCGLRGERAELLRNLRRQGLLDSLAKQGYLAPFDVVSGVPDYPLVFRLVRTPRISYCHEWSTAMWKDASLHLLKLLMALAEHGLTLRYPHPWHLLFDGPNPTYIHPGSIVPLEVSTFRGAFDRISRFLLRPLALASQRQTALARQLLRDANRGVDLSVGDLQSAHNLQTEELHRMTPTEFLSRRIQEVQAFLMPEGDSKWAEYQRELPFKASDGWHRKEHCVHAVLREIQPRRVLDLACNLGWYARLAAVEGADVVAADIDELCVNRMYSTCRGEGSRVLPLVINVTDPAPGSGVANAWFPPATERLKSDLVLALAIMHHLVFGSHRLVMSEIVRAFASFTDHALLLEFVPLQSQGCVYSGAQRPEAIGWYTLDNCVASLGHVFRKVEILPGAQHSRRLLLCEK